MPGHVGNHDSGFPGNGFGRGPLFELDDDEVCRAMNIVPRNDEVHTSAGGWQTIFDQHAAVSGEVGHHQHALHKLQRVGPGSVLSAVLRNIRSLYSHKKIWDRGTVSVKVVLTVSIDDGHDERAICLSVLYLAEFP